MEIGVYGLGVMGKALTRNFLDKKIAVKVYNRTTLVTESFVKELTGADIEGFDTFESFVASLAVPRKILIMVPDKAVQKVISELSEFLDKGDIIIDGGNSYFENTKNRFEELGNRGIRFLGCGISGGERGAINGPSLMFGGDKSAYDEIQPLFEKIVAKDFEGGACVGFMGTSMAGHYTKMVHNGIEYGIMQLIAELYHCLRYGLGLSSEKITSFLSDINDGRNHSFLLERMIEVSLGKTDNGQLIIDTILDSAGQKGTGKWTAIEAFKLGVAAPSINAAVDQRNLSASLKLRSAILKIFDGEFDTAETQDFMDDVDIDDVFVELETCFYQAVLIVFIQGFEILQAASSEYELDLNMAQIARVWQGGCIIQARVLKDIRDFYLENPDENLLLSGLVKKALFEEIWEINDLLDDFRNQLLPGFSAAWYYWLTLTFSRSGAEVIQGLRDSFGSHGYQRIDKEGQFHTDWQEFNLHK